MGLTLSSGHAVVIFDEIDSTNLEAKRRFLDGTDAPCWFLAHRQTAGYGRQQRSWLQAERDFAGSLLLPIVEGETADVLALTSFVTALAVDRTLQACGISSGAITLKWPNDVLLHEGKVAGILLELIECDGMKALVVGIGVNIVSAPDIPDYKTASLADVVPFENLPSVERFLEKLDQYFSETWRELRQNGFASIRSDWLERAYNLGGQIRVRLPKEELEGIFEGIDSTGALVLREGAAVHHITSGDVFFSSVQ